MVGNTGAFVAMVIAQQQMQEKQRQEEEQEKARKQEVTRKEEHICKSLLLGRKGTDMKIGKNEKIKVVHIFLSTSRNGMSWNEMVWNAKVETDKIATGYTFGECFENTMKVLNPIEIELLPMSVSKDIVDGYTLLAKVEDEKAVLSEKEKEECLQIMANNMSKDIENAW